MLKVVNIGKGYNRTSLKVLKYLPLTSAALGYRIAIYSTRYFRIRNLKYFNIFLILYFYLI